MANAARSTNIAELQRMFSNLDSNVIESVLAANNGQIDLTIDHLLTMSIDTETTNNIHQSTPITPLRQLPAISNLYEDDPPPYPGLENNSDTNTSIVSQNRQHTPRQGPLSISNRSSPIFQHASDRSPPREIHVQKWRTPYGQSRICYIGDLSDDFLKVNLINSNSPNSTVETSNTSKKTHRSVVYDEDDYIALLLKNEEFLLELRHNKDFLNTLHSDEPSTNNLSTSKRKSLNQFSTKALPLPTPPTIETPKPAKVRAHMLQNALTQIEQGQIIKTPMVPQQSITEKDGYSYGRDENSRFPLPAAPTVKDIDPNKTESNEEFIGRLKNMGKSSMEKFNQLARRFSTVKGTNLIDSMKSPRPSILFNRTDRQKLSNEFEIDDDFRRMTNDDSDYRLKN